MDTDPNEQGSRGTPEGVRLRIATAGEVLGDAVRNYRSNGDTNQAAAIALYAILSIIPLFILTLLLVSNLFSSDPEIQRKLIEGIRQLVPSFSGDLLMQFSRIEGKKELLGWAGIISLIWFSAAIFGSVETALNITFRSKIQRNYFVSKLLAIAMIPLGWAIGVISVGITYVAAILSRQPLLAQGGLSFLPEVNGIVVRYLLPYLVTVLFFTVLYKVIPTKTISWKSAVIGSAIFSALMEVAKQFFTWYVASYTRYHLIFGSLEAVVILVIWVFYVALILLFCAELISSYQRREMLLLEQAILKPRSSGTPVDERLLRKFDRLYGRDEYLFHEGDPGRGIFYILSGRVRMERGTGEAKKLLAEMGPGEYFGVAAALNHTRYTTSARSLEESHIAEIDGETLRSLLRESEEVSLFLLQEFARRIGRGSEALEELRHSWVELIATLFFFRSWPLPAGSDPEAELARLTGREPGQIGEVLADLGRQGILTIRDGRVAGFNRDAALQKIDALATGH